jgi:hypothetical protein
MNEPMKKLFPIALIALLIFACNERKIQTEKPEPIIEFNQALADELKKMAEVDQIAAYIPQGKYKELSQAQWESFKDSVFRTHQKRLDEIFKKYGFPGYDLVGKEGSGNFWLMVQHSDHDPEFQQHVLEKMKIEVDKDNAEASTYGLLVDRVNLNTGQPQIYGTQVTYNTEICQAYPKNLADSANVNERRKSIGLPPIEEYLNQMTQMHFDMNKENYLSRGIKAPKLYKTE